MVSRRIVVLGGLATVVSVSGCFHLPFATRALTGNAMPFLEADAWYRRLNSDHSTVPRSSAAPVTG
ncbi:hypothetical protein SAMN05443582_102717 [Phyllobacterium sp. OV277]|nr:hypothetical protein SAMN05443582_102717 [Phyllobacterium sp. OV277]